MRFVFFLLFILCFYAPLFSQQPTKEQMQAQMKQAKQEAQQQIGELEAQIAEAKKNKEDPESIREAEDGTWMWCHQIKKRHSDHQSFGQIYP
jgi:regulator of protease activity HflC (stomatin/prohibitin superfamily)